MKALLKTSILFLLPFILLLSCKKEEVEGSKQYLMKKNAGLVTAKLNGVNWQNTLVLSKYLGPDLKYMGFIIEVYDGKTQVQEFAFEGIDYRKKVNKLRGLAGSQVTDPVVSFANVDYEQALALYLLIEDSTYDNHVKITSYDPATDMVSGTFQVSLYFDRGEIQPGFTDMLHFTDGKFALKISPAR